MKLLICLSTIALITIRCQAQTASVSSAETDTTAIITKDSIKLKSTLTLGLVYCLNADYYGQEALQKLPYVAGAATYHLKSGIYFTGLAYKLLNDTSKHITSAENIGAGIEIKISKKLSADINYSHSFYPGFSPFLQASSPDNASASLSYEAWLKPTLGVDYAFGKTSDIFSTIGISKAISLGSISTKDVVMLTPSISMVEGTQHFFQTYITQKKLADSLLGILFQPVSGDQTTQNNSFTKTITTFNILSYNFKLLLDYNRSNYVVEASGQFSQLTDHTQSAPGKLNSFFSISFFYQF